MNPADVQLVNDRCPTDAGVVGRRPSRTARRQPRAVPGVPCRRWTRDAKPPPGRRPGGRRPPWRRDRAGPCPGQSSARQATLRLGAGHVVGVVARAAEEGLGDPAVPDPSGLVAEVIEAVRENGIDQVRFGVEQQRNALRVLGVESEVPRRGFLDPAGAQGERSSFRRGPVHRQPPSCSPAVISRAGPSAAALRVQPRASRWRLRRKGSRNTRPAAA